MNGMTTEKIAQTQLKDSGGNAVPCVARAQEESPPESSPTGTSSGSASVEPPVSTLPGAAVPPAPGLSQTGQTEGANEGEGKAA